MMEQKTTIINKKEQFIDIFPKNNFNISKTCRDLSIDRKKYYKWMEQKSFKEKLKESVERKKDLIEDKLMEEAMKGNITALIFLAKTQMKERGYVEKQEIESNVKVESIDVDKIVEATKNGVPYR